VQRYLHTQMSICQACQIWERQAKSTPTKCPKAQFHRLKITKLLILSFRALVLMISCSTTDYEVSLFWFDPKFAENHLKTIEFLDNLY
jgi:hypothetical protein